MHTNSEKILRYLSQLMDEKEKNEFELEINTNTQLSNEFDLLKAKLNELNVSNVEFDERYFNALLPKIKNRIEKPAKSKLLPRLAYGLPTLAVVILSGIIFIKSGITTNNGVAEISTEIVNNIDNEIVSSKYISEFDLYVNGIYDYINDKSDYKEIDYDESTRNKILAVYDYPVDYELYSLEKLTKEELQSIYLEITPQNY